MFALIASDLDGTLLDEHHRINDFTANTLNQLLSQGVELVLATGRHHQDVRGLTSKLIRNPWLITSNGATLHTPDGELMFQSTVAQWIVREVMDTYCQHPDLWLNVYHDHAWLINKEATDLEAYHAESGFLYEVVNFAEHSGEAVLKILLLGDHQALREIEPVLRERYGEFTHITFSAESCLELMAKGTSKGSTLGKLLNHLSINAAQCVAFGDHLNDIEMLQSVGQACVMQNASPGLVAAVPGATRVGHHRESAVANFLRQHWQFV